MAASSFYNRVKYTPASAGTGDFVTSAAVTGFLTPATASIPNGTLVSYVAFNSTQTEWETGQGAYTSGTTTLARTTVRESSNAGAKVNFTAAPTVGIDSQAQDFTNLPSLAIGGATIGTNALAVNGQVTNAGGTITTNQPFTITQTWNAAGVTFVGLKIDIANTASGAASKPLDVLFAGATVLGVREDSLVFFDKWASISGTQVARSDAGYFNATVLALGSGGDTFLSRSAAGTSQFGTSTSNAAGSWLATNGTLSGYLAGAEMSAPAAPAADGYRIFAQDNGGGKTQLMVIFSSGAAQQIAIQP